MDEYLKDIKTCPACNSDKFIIIGKPPLQNKDSKYNVIKCQYCELKWSSPLPSSEELEEHYRKYYALRDSTVDKVTLKKKIKDYISFREYRINLLIKCIEKYSEKGLMVDFGCGRAEPLYIAKKRKWNVLGIDYSNELKDVFIEDGIEFVHSNDILKSGLKEHSVDCIIFKHLLEHIPDIKGFLEKSRKVLKKGGIVAIKSPSSTSFRARLNLATWHFVNPPEHLWGFTKLNFKRLMENNSFEVLYLKDSLFVDELICIARVKTENLISVLSNDKKQH